jgi:hypothetical protein
MEVQCDVRGMKWTLTVRVSINLTELAPYKLGLSTTAFHGQKKFSLPAQYYMALQPISSLGLLFEVP